MQNSSTQHIGDEDNSNESDGNSSVDDLNIETNDMAADRFLPPPSPFNMEVTDLYNEWKQWSNALHICATATEERKKADEIQRATMLHCLGPTVQRIFDTLLGERTTLLAATQALEGYFAPKHNVVAERYKFRLRQQLSDEPIDAYFSKLRHLAKSCEFGAMEDEMIRDQIVEKCHSRHLKQKLLQQENLTLEQTLKTARSVESAPQEARLLTSPTGTKDDPIPVDRIKSKSRRPPKQEPKQSSKNTSYACYRCGGTDGHNASECAAIKSKCNPCKKIGHFARVCRSKRPPENQKPNHKRDNQTPRKVRTVTTTDWLEDSNQFG